MRTQLIEDYIKKLAHSLGGVRADVDPAHLRLLYKKKDFTGMVEYIATALALHDAQVRIEEFVNSGGPADTPLWMYRSRIVPLYGTEEFKKMLFTIYARKSFLAHAPLESIVFGFAHELSHIILYSIQHELKNEEIAVDLTAMLLGFRLFYLVGWHYVEFIEIPSTRNVTHKMWHTVTAFFFNNFPQIKRHARHYVLGYLRFDEIVFAANLLENMRRKT